MQKRLSKETYIQGILAGDRVVLSRAITLIESTLPSDRLLATEVLEQILPYTGNATRIGITGVPGVGKSTFIETFGSHLAQTQAVAVLAIDPSSQISKGSILGDKTRMETLAHNPRAYIRPSPAGNSLGGVAHKTRETMLLCEAAGFEIIIVETVGVGQSETLVHGMVDFFLLLMLAGAGDELQGIKKGIIEMVDAIAITKVDGDNQRQAQIAKVEYENALHLFPANHSGWLPKVMTCSATENTGIAEIWEMIQAHRTLFQEKNLLQKHRAEQNLAWMHHYIRQNLEEQFYTNPIILEVLKDTEEAVKAGKLLPIEAGNSLLKSLK